MGHFRSLPTTVLGLAAMFAVHSSALAQSDTSTIAGNVKDSSGAVVPQAKITIQNEGTGAAGQAESNESGHYAVTSLPAGAYAVRAEVSGFKQYTSTGNRLDANLPLNVDIVLEVGQAGESVNVTADSQRLQTETATVGQLVDAQQVKNILLNGRNAVLLAALKPGVRSNASLANFNFNLTSGGFSINGSRPDDNVFFTDGAVATRTRSNGTSIGSADLATGEGPHVLSRRQTSEYGRAGGGQIRILTKSGGHDSPPTPSHEVPTTPPSATPYPRTH